MNATPFIKMHGLGNDFVVLDARETPVPLDGEAVRAIADRHTGVGCDQLITLGAPRNPDADVFMGIKNADGGEVEACGNATRCVAALIMAEKKSDRAVIETGAGLLAARGQDGGLISVDMGPARLDWGDIPLARETDTLHLDFERGPFADPVAVNMGNPHAVFFVDDVEAAPLEDFGAAIEHDALFPQCVNVGAAQVLADGAIRLRVWERGVGLTRACGTGACAALVAANRRGLTGAKADVVLDGGTLGIEWREDGNVMMTGPVAVSFRGVLDVTLEA
ncbi:MAG TPA: diaminopimelate epimerase [Rhodospirillales bacterium]|nr:diaminopimelate epimerase [Rhodospirillales bacterium]